MGEAMRLVIDRLKTENKFQLRRVEEIRKSYEAQITALESQLQAASLELEKLVLVMEECRNFHRGMIPHLQLKIDKALSEFSGASKEGLYTPVATESTPSGVSVDPATKRKG